MPHYVVSLDEQDTRFGLYSTIVDGLIWVETDAATMRQWLETEGYDSWLQKGGTPLEELIEHYGESTGKSIYDSQKRERELGFMYWHPEGFNYAKASDAYYCLPMSMWNE